MFGIWVLKPEGLESPGKHFLKKKYSLPNLPPHHPHISISGENAWEFTLLEHPHSDPDSGLLGTTVLAFP